MIRTALLSAALSVPFAAIAQDCTQLLQHSIESARTVLQGMPSAPRFDGEERMPSPARSAQVAQQSLVRILAQSKAASSKDKGTTLNALLSSHQALVVVGELKQSANLYDGGAPEQKYTVRATDLSRDIVRYADCIGTVLSSMAVQP